MRYGSVCSGIACDTVAWKTLGWEAAFYAEIEERPSAVLKHHYPETLNLGDIKNVKKEHGPIDLLGGGTPCQSFSVAGKRLGLDDPRGHLALEYCRVLDRIHPEWFVWENVPGTLSSWSGQENGKKGGWEEESDFVCLLEAFRELGYSCAWRVLDAQNFGVPQRRRRVFVVGHISDWRGPFAVLFEPTSLQRNIKAGGKKGQKTASGIAAGLNSGGNSGGFRTEPVEHLILTNAPLSFNARQDPIVSRDVTQPLDTDGGTIAIATRFKGAIAVRTAQTSSNGWGIHKEAAYTLDGSTQAVQYGTLIRRLMPMECERLQGLPDNYTLVPFKNKPMSDSARYNMIGNGMAVPVMAWLGRRIQMMHDILKARAK